jgi:tetratricopeptide (TPR) repeat protein
MQALTLATNSDSDNSVLARANYNLGNAFFKKEDYDEAIKHYKKSLMLSPGNKDAAWNLEVARLNKKKKEEEQKKKQDQDKQNQDKQNQDKQDQDKQNQDKQDQDKKDQEKQKQDQQKQDQQKKEQQQQQQQQQPQETPDKKQMDKILKAIENEDSNFHKNKARARGLRNAAGSKDW